MNRASQRIIGPILLAIVVMLSLASAPAFACGIYLPLEGDASMAQEGALFPWDGKTEDLAMELSVEGRSSEAAWVVPAPARATVKLADAGLFDALQELTKPLVQIQVGEPPTTAPAGGGVETGAAATVRVLERQALGPFEVSTLAADDAQALQSRLTEHGYAMPAGAAPLLATYVAEGWYYVAVRLVPAQAGAGLTGQLEPLWLSFAADEIVYPMRLFALTDGMLPVFLYVLADHRVAEPKWSDPASDGAYPISLRTPFAEWVEPQQLPQGSPVAPFIERKRFLTKFDIYFDNPSAITSDFVFPLARRDTAYRDVQIQYVPEDDPRVVAAANRAAARTVASVASTLIVCTVVAFWSVLVLWFARVVRRQLQ